MGTFRFEKLLAILVDFHLPFDDESLALKGQVEAAQSRAYTAYGEHFSSASDTRPRAMA
jgi:hypothetical protein